jgi:hypothetical protein
MTKAEKEEKESLKLQRANKDAASGWRLSARLNLNLSYYLWRW